MTQFIVNNEARMSNIIDTVLRKLTFDHPWEVVVRPYKKTRSGAQNSLLWVWLTELEEETGNDKEGRHEYFKQRFLGVESQEIMGREVAITNSSKKLKVAEFSDYLRNIEMVALQNGYVLSHPSTTNAPSTAACRDWEIDLLRCILASTYQGDVT